MNPIQKALGGLIGSAVSSVGDAAAVQAAAQYEKVKPLVYAAAFMTVTVYLFFFLPRFSSPLRRAN